MSRINHLKQQRASASGFWSQTGSAAVVLVPLIALGVSGCSAQGSSDAPTSVVRTESSVAAPVSDVTTIANGLYQEGDYFLSGNGVKVTDVDGDYEESYRPTLDDFSGADTQPLLPALVAAGFTEEDVKLAKQLATNIALDFSFDSPITDRTVSDGEYAEWFEKIISMHALDAQLKEGISNKKNGVVLTGFVDSNHGQLPKLVRDSFPRIAEGDSKSIAVFSTLPLDVNGQTQLDVTLDTNILYRVSDEAAIDFTSAVSGMNSEEVLASLAKPSLQDGSGTNYLRVHGKYDVVFTKSGTDLIATTIQNQYELDASDYSNE